MNDNPERLDPTWWSDSSGVPTAILEPAKLLAAEPSLVNAAWDWGGGDWETALGAAAHMGRRDIAELLLDRGARLDIFAAAMLGEVAVVRAMLAAFPGLREARGPHGIPLAEHARKGGEPAQGVLELLEGAAVSSTSG